MTKYCETIGTPEQSKRFHRLVSDIDSITDRVQDTLSMHPYQLFFKVVLYDTRQEVSDKHYDLYKNRDGYERISLIAFASATWNTIYISVEDASDRVLAHEIVHVIINLVCPKLSIKCHEWLAQIVERKLYENH